MAGGAGGDLVRMLSAVLTSTPVDSVGAMARVLADRYDAAAVSLFVLDLTGKALVRVSTGADEREGERSPLIGSRYERAVRTQRAERETVAGTGQERLIVPMTNRGDTVGLVDLVLPAPLTGPDREALELAVQLAAYVIIADQRFTDLYIWGRRSEPLALSASVQHQLLPPSQSCETPEFALAGALEPTGEISGDTFDYSLDRDSLHISVTDPVGHDVGSSVLATILVAALRSARRAATGLLEQALRANQALAEHGHGHATGQLLRIKLKEGSVQFVNAGHPPPYRMRDGVVEEVECSVDQPFGLPFPATFRVQHLDLRPGDRLIVLTDGMLERSAERVDWTDVIGRTGNLSPRVTVRAMAETALEAGGGRLDDDATVLCFDWYGADRTGR